MKTRKEFLIAEILLQCKANDVPNRDVVFMNLIGLSESELIKIAYELNIKIPKKSPEFKKAARELSNKLTDDIILYR